MAYGEGVYGEGVYGVSVSLDPWGESFWPVNYAGCNGMPEPLASMPASGVQVFEQMAVEYLWRWTGGQFGLVDLTVRPCREDCQASTFFGGAMPGTNLPTIGAPWTPLLMNGKWYNLGCTCGDNCSCSVVHQITLPGPVNSVIEVVVDGEVLPSSSYRVDNRRFLVRTDGYGWPLCNDLNSPSASGTGAEGTWQVRYLRGSVVPIGGQVAAGLLASEFAKSACGDKNCALPKRVQSVTRQNVTIGMLDTFDDIEVGHTGIWPVDAWIASIRKGPKQSRVYSPDVRYPRRTS
jgi:hypothetical protein